MNPLWLPLVALQRAWLRFAPPDHAPPASGPASGVARAGPELAAAPQFRLAVLGDSIAAGCGVETHAHGLAASLAQILAARIGHSVQWEAVGQYGATARRVRYRLLEQLDDGLDLAVLVVGFNDAAARRTPTEWNEDLAAIVGDLSGRSRQVLVVGIPPVTSFPGLRKPLSGYLEERAGALNILAEKHCAPLPDVRWLSPTRGWLAEPGVFCADGMHLSASGYRELAQILAQAATY